MPQGRRDETEALGVKPSPAESNEVRLVGLIAGQDPHAFEVLYRIYFPRLARFLDRMTRSTHLIEEIVNDTMWVVWQKAHTFNHTSKVSTWIFSIAYRKALKAIQYLDEPVEFDFEQCASDGAQQPEHEMQRRQLQKIVGGALDALPEEQRTVVNLTYYHAMEYIEIAEIMDCPVNTIKTRMFHARRRLKSLLSACLGAV